MNSMKRVMVFGTFDILHLGHIHLLTEAKKLGDELIAVVSRDKNAQEVKGKETLHSESERVSLLDHIDLVDKSVLGNSENVYQIIAEYTPDIIALGYDQVAFVDGLTEWIKKQSFSIEVTRISSYEPTKHKSSLIKEALHTMI